MLCSTVCACKPEGTIGKETVADASGRSAECLAWKHQMMCCWSRMELSGVLWLSSGVMSVCVRSSCSLDRAGARRCSCRLVGLDKPIRGAAPPLGVPANNRIPCLCAMVPTGRERTGLPLTGDQRCDRIQRLTASRGKSVAASDDIHERNLRGRERRGKTWIGCASERRGDTAGDALLIADHAWQYSGDAGTSIEQPLNGLFWNHLTEQHRRCHSPPPSE